MMWYLASPYTNYDEGPDAAYDDICEQAALLLNAGVDFISPISHFHGIARHGVYDDTHEGWMRVCAPLMHLCDGLLVCKIPGWEESDGIREEIGVFQLADKPIAFMEPGEIPRGL